MQFFSLRFGCDYAPLVCVSLFLDGVDPPDPLPWGLEGVHGRIQE